MVYILVIILLNSVFIMFMKNLDRKEILTIVKDNSSLKLFLTGDLYLETDIPNDIDLNSFIKDILKNRAFELSTLVGRVEFVNVEVDKNIDYLSYLK